MHFVGRSVVNYLSIMRGMQDTKTYSYWHLWQQQYQCGSCNNFWHGNEWRDSGVNKSVPYSVYVPCLHLHPQNIYLKV